MPSVTVQLPCGNKKQIKINGNGNLLESLNNDFGWYNFFGCFHFTVFGRRLTEQDTLSDLRRGNCNLINLVLTHRKYFNRKNTPEFETISAILDHQHGISPIRNDISETITMLVIIDEDEIEYPMHASLNTPFIDVMAKYATAHDLNLEYLSFKYEDHVINGNETVASLGLKSNDIIYVKMSNPFDLQILGPNNATLTTSIDIETPLKYTKQRFLLLLDKRRENYFFVANDKIVKDEDTVQSLGLVEGDVIEVHHWLVDRKF